MEPIECGGHVGRHPRGCTRGERPENGGRSFGCGVVRAGRAVALSVVLAAALACNGGGGTDESGDDAASPTSGTETAPPTAGPETAQPAAEPETDPAPPETAAARGGRRRGGTPPAAPEAGPASEPAAPVGEPASEPEPVPDEPVADSGSEPTPGAEPGVAPEEPAAEPVAAPARRAAGRIAFVSDRGGAWRIYLAAADGSGVVPLTTGEAPAWSPDGTRIAFHRPGDGVYVIDATGANERSLGRGISPSWSPDGTQIAFATGSGTAGGVYVMNADGTGRRLVIDNEFASPGWGDYCVCSPAWSPDGRTIAFVRANYDEGFGIYTIEADGSGSPRPVPGGGWAQDRPEWSPDGARIAFETAGPGGDQIASVTPSGGDLEVHVINATGYVGAPAWSPDGRSLAFSRASPRGAPTRIFVAREDGSVERLIPEAQSPAEPGYWDRDPAWSWAD